MKPGEKKQVKPGEKTGEKHVKTGEKQVKISDGQKAGVPWEEYA